VVVVVTVGMAALTLARYGVTADGLGWSVAQLLLGFIAGWDLLTRRILNVVVLPASLIVIALRAAFAPSVLPESLISGAVAFLVFLVLVIAFGEGLGMGDMKLAGLLGLLLGRAAVGALLAGCVAGGVAAALLVLSGRADRKSTFAYGPYLALGGALWILVGAPPALF
jgi:leader peptidase (prepilin peptidase)/N-methyltransferase